MSKQIKTTSSKITACPECDSGNLYQDGSSVECLSCGWKHTATKKPRTAPKSKDTPPAPSLAEQLAAAVTATPAKKERAAKTQDDGTKYVIIKEFKPRTDQLMAKGAEGKGNFSQMHNWAAISDLLKAGPATRSELEAVIKAAAEAGGYLSTCNARGFVQGRVRNGHIAPAK